MAIPKHRKTIASLRRAQLLPHSSSFYHNFSHATLLFNVWWIRGQYTRSHGQNGVKLACCHTDWWISNYPFVLLQILSTEQTENLLEFKIKLNFNPRLQFTQLEMYATTMCQSHLNVIILPSPLLLHCLHLFTLSVATLVTDYVYEPQIKQTHRGNPLIICQTWFM